MDEALKLARLARYARQRARERESTGKDAGKWRDASHSLIQILCQAVKGEISSGRLADLCRIVDEIGKNNDNSVYSIDISGNSGKIKLGNSHADGGPGSGNHGHKGVPGQRGGSAPSGSPGGGSVSETGHMGKAPDSGTSKSNEAAPSQKAANELQSAIKAGIVSTKLHTKKQSKHTKGSVAYNKAVAKGDKVSVMTLGNDEIQKLISQYSGTGKIYSKNGQIKEVFEHSSSIGIHVSAKGKESVTNRGTIHYGKDGSHIVPASPKGGGKK